MTVLSDSLSPFYPFKLEHLNSNSHLSHWIFLKNEHVYLEREIFETVQGRGTPKMQEMNRFCIYIFLGMIFKNLLLGLEYFVCRIPKFLYRYLGIKDL